MRIIHTSDIHLHKEHPERFEALERVIEKTKELKGDYLVIAGDLFQDPESASELFTNLRTVFNGLPFKVIVIPGNHDYTLYLTQRDFGNSAIVLNHENNIYQDIDFGVTFFTIPYSTTIVPETFHLNLAATTQKLSREFLNIFIYHGDLEEVVLRVRARSKVTGEETGKAFSVNLVYITKQGNINLVLAGHYHNAYGDFSFGDGGNFIYSGSPVSVTKSDQGVRSVNLVEIEDKRLKGFERVPLDTYYYKSLAINLTGFEPDPVDAVTQRVREEFQKSGTVRLLFSVKGFLNRSISGIGEKDFSERVLSSLKSIWGDRVILDEMWNEVRDISTIMSKPYCRNIFDKIENSDRSEEEKVILKKMLIQAIIGAG
ncbi:MAG: metallophosphoesterase [candidate division WOR-3 bacterium]